MSNPSIPRIVPRPTSRNGLLRFFWSAPLSDGDGSGISSYTLFSSSPAISVSYPAFINREDVTGLSNGVPYSFGIYATNSNGLDSSPEFFLTRTPCDFPGSPPNISFTPFSNSLALNVQWSTPSFLGGGDTTLDHFAISLFPTDANSNVLSNFSTGLNVNVYTYGSSNSRLVYYPSPFYNYKFIVRSINQAGWSGNNSNLFTFLNVRQTNPEEFGALALWLDSTFEPSLYLNDSNVISFTSRVSSIIFNTTPIPKVFPSISSFSTTNINNRC